MGGKYIRYFMITFVVTMVVGGLGMLGYEKLYKKQKTQTVSVQDKGVLGGADAAALSEGATENEHESATQTADETGEDSDFGTPQSGKPEGADADSKGDMAGSDQKTNISNGSSENVIAQQEGKIEVDQVGQAVLVFGGDVCFHDPYANMCSYVQRGSDIEKCISEYLLQEMRDADICMVNNEFSYSGRGEPLADKMYTFRSKPENVNILHDMGVDIVSVANNHAYDFGRDAFLDTLQILDDAGICRVGGGENLEDASKPVYFTVNGLKIGYVAATQIERNETPDTKGATETAPGVLRCFNEGELEHFLEIVKKAKKECDFLVAYMHWGTENTDETDWAQPYQANLLSSAGADLIVGCHPHCLQGMDVIGGIPVIYSLGNYWFNSKTLDTALLKVVVGENGLESLQMIAAQQADCATKELLGSEKARVLNYLQELSPNLTIDEDGIVTW